MYKRYSECCKYREETRKKSAAKKKKKSESNKLNRHDDCQENQVKSVPSIFPKRKKILKPQSSKNDSEIDDLLLRIKPAISVREKYFNPHHVICFLEGKQNENSYEQNGKIYSTAKSKPREDKIKKSIRKKMKEKLRKNTNRKDPSWCETSTKKELSKSTDLKCDSVCSFDSVVDLTGLALTREEKEKIAKNRLRLQPSVGNKKEKREEEKETKAKESKEKELNQGEVIEDQGSTQVEAVNEEPEAISETDGPPTDNEEQ